VSAGRHPAHGHSTATVNSASAPRSTVEHLSAGLRVLAAGQYQGVITFLANILVSSWITCFVCRRCLQKDDISCHMSYYFTK